MNELFKRKKKKAKVAPPAERTDAPTVAAAEQEPAAAEPAPSSKPI